MIKITDDANRIDREAWDFPTDEIDYLLKEHDGETFVLKSGRLYEAEQQQEEEQETRKNTGTFECFHCGARAVVWDSDYSFEDVGLIGDGLVQVLHCAACGATIEYYLDFEEDEEDQE